MRRLLSILIAFLLLSISFSAKAQSLFEKRIEQAEQAYRAKNYDTAEKCYKLALDISGSESEKAIANDGIRKSRNAKAQFAAQQKAEAITLSTGVVDASADGGVYEVSYQTESIVSLLSAPSWCVVECLPDVIKINVQANPNQNVRDGRIVFKQSLNGYRSSSKQFEIDVVQGAGYKSLAHVRFNTNPSYSDIMFLDNSKLGGLSTQFFDLEEGRHKVRVSKQGYMPLDTIVTVVHSSRQYSEVLDIKLKPIFSILEIDPLFDGGGFLAAPQSYKVFVNDIAVLLGGDENAHSFNRPDNSVLYFQQYENNQIPVIPGQYKILIDADGFEPFSYDVTALSGTTHRIEGKIRSRNGALAVTGTKLDGAKMILNGWKQYDSVLDSLELPAGEYYVSFIKDRYLSDKDVYRFSIVENETSHVEVAMDRYVKVLVSSNVEGSTVYVDGVPSASTEEEFVLRNGFHNIVVAKDGYSQNALPGMNFNAEVSERYELTSAIEKLYPLLVSSDKRDLRTTVFKNLASNNTYEPRYLLPDTLMLEHGRYIVESTNRDGSLAYKRSFNFTGKKNSYRIHPFSSSPLRFFSIQSYPTGKIADISAMCLEPFSGLTIPFLRSSLFSSGYILSEDNNRIVMGWALLTSMDLRIGGRITDYLDIAAMASYSYLPSFWKEFWDDVSGHQFFAGVELTSRFGLLNINVRAGKDMMFNGSLNVRESSASLDYISIPFNYDPWTVSIGLSLSGRKKDILRLWF